MDDPFINVQNGQIDDVTHVVDNSAMGNDTETVNDGFPLVRNQDGNVEAENENDRNADRNEERQNENDRNKNVIDNNANNNENVIVDVDKRKRPFYY